MAVPTSKDNGKNSKYQFKTTSSKVGVTHEDDQEGFEVDVRAVDAQTSVGPALFNASALSAGCEGSVGRNSGGFVRGHLAKFGGTVGRVSASTGIGFDTGARVGVDGVEAKLFGCGGVIDKNKGIGVSFFGSSIRFKPWGSSKKNGNVNANGDKDKDSNSISSDNDIKTSDVTVTEITEITEISDANGVQRKVVTTETVNPTR